MYVLLDCYPSMSVILRRKTGGQARMEGQVEGGKVVAIATR